MLIPFTQGWLSSGKKLTRFGSTKRRRQVLAVAPKVAAIANLFDLELCRKLIGLTKDNRHECKNNIVWILISVDFENTAKDEIVEDFMTQFLIDTTHVSIWQWWAAIAINLLFDNRLYNNFYCQLSNQEIRNLNQILIRKLLFYPLNREDLKPIFLLP